MKVIFMEGVPDLGYKIHFRAMAKWTRRFGEILGPCITSLNRRNSFQLQNLQLTLECSWSSSHLPLEHLGCNFPLSKKRLLVAETDVCSHVTQQSLSREGGWVLFSVTELK